MAAMRRYFPAVRRRNIRIKDLANARTSKTSLILGFFSFAFFGMLLTVMDFYELMSYRRETLMRTKTPIGIGDKIPINAREPKRILFYDPYKFQKVRNVLNMSFFEDCEVNNCQLTFEKSEANVSDAIIFHLWLTEKYPEFRRPKGQIWIMVQHESTQSYIRYKKPSPFYKNSFNWTMTYSPLSDVHLPYGMLRHIPEGNRLKRDYLKIAKNKTKDALWVVSHCMTFSKRMAYAKILKEHITIDILGRCGQNWTCGTRFDHDLDNCFDILNSTYRYYLAFENNMCQEYVTEKFYENYKYDIIQVVRGGNPNERPIDISKDAYISASDFQNAHELGMHLKGLSSDTMRYAKMLEKKDEYQPVGYKQLFKRSVCEICKRLHNVEKYMSVYEDPVEWIKINEPCFNSDLII